MVFLVGGFTIFLKTEWYAASNPVVHILDLKPSHEHDTTGILSSSLNDSTTDSISSPIIPDAQEVVTKIALGFTLL